CPLRTVSAGLAYESFSLASVVVGTQRLCVEPDVIALDLMLDTVPDSLVGEAAHKRLRRIRDHLPDALAERIGLELRLHDDPQADLLLRVATRRQLEILGGTDDSVSLGVELVSHPAWEATARLARRALCLIGEE